MLSRLAIRGMIGGAAGYAIKEAVASKFNLENPALLVVLPAAIVRHAVTAYATPEFDCPYRKQLHQDCSNVSLFDKMTIPPVNIDLHHQKTPLTKDSYKALKEDLMHSKQMSPDDPMHKKIQDYYQQGQNQRAIAESFHKAGEREGAVLHTLLATGFDIRAGLAEQVSQGMEKIKGPD